MSVLRQNAIALFLSILLSGQALAHRTTTGDTSGIAIPALTHGQMTVIADKMSAILALADRQPFPDMTFQRLRNYIGLQYAACVWGLAPASIQDEASPFNECSHAYLSATQALLLYMKGMRGDTKSVVALVEDINIEMLHRNASLILCQFSNETFNTADLILPEWSLVLFHWPSLLAALGALVGAGAIMFSVVMLLRQPRNGQEPRQDRSGNAQLGM